MKKLILFAVLASSLAYGQSQAVRIENFTWTTNRIGGIRPVVPIPNATVQVCNFPANAVPCSNYATTYTDISMGTQCNGSNGCSNPMVTDDNGKFGVWVAPGTYQYTYTTASGLNFGPYTVTLAITGTIVATAHNLLGASHLDTVPYSPPVNGDWIQGNNSGKWQAQHGNTSTTPQFMMSLGNGSTVVSQGFTTVGAPCSGGQFANGINNDLTPSCATVTVPNQITPPPPFPVPAGQAIAWAFPATSVYGPADSGATNGGAYSTPNYGYVTMTASSPLGNWTWGAQWQGFAMPTLPGDAVIQGIYGVMVASKVGGGRAACGTTKPNLYTESTEWTGANFNWPSGNTLGEYYTTTLGSTTSTVTSMICAIQEFQTLGLSYNPPLQVTAYSMVLAIYYTTASPPQNTQYTLPVPASYNSLLGVSTPYSTLSDASPIAWNVGGNYISNAKVTLAHTLSTRALNVSNLVEGGNYTLTITQDSTGGAVLTAGTGCTWINPDGSLFSPSVNTAPSAVSFITWRFNGTYCLVNQTLGGVNNQTGTSYTLVAGDGGGYVRMNNASANTVTIPPNSSVAFSIGTIVSINQVGAGQTSLVAGAGVTINTPSTLNARAQHSTISVTKVGTNEWDASGDLQ